MTIPDEAVKAAVEAYGDRYRSIAAMQDALTAALPFLQGVKVKDVKPTELTKALSRLAGNRHSDGVSSIISADDRSVIINGCYEMMIALKTPSTRAQALEEAAQLCENNVEELGGGTRKLAPFDHGTQGIHAGMTYASAIRALSSQPVADGWLPIETAPKDGTPFLVFVPDDKFSDGTGIDVIWYDEEQWLFGYNTPFVPANNPTHWRPLPASPGASTRPTGGSNHGE